MKSNNLPLLSLRAFASAALVSFGLLATATDSLAGTMHSDVSVQTYTDFGQNKGRYAVGANVNALLNHIRKTEGGISITYTDGTETFYIPYEQGMINFSGTDDIGAQVAIGPNSTATVLHNGSINASFGNRVVGSDNAINYSAIDIRHSKVFRLYPTGWGENNGHYDYMLQRQSKIITDTTWNPLATINAEELDTLDGKYLYHSGSGAMNVWINGAKQGVPLDGYATIIGGINNISNAQWHNNNETNISIHQDPKYGNGIGASIANPLPNGIEGGDSGSPVFIYNETTKQYEYIAAQQSGGGHSYSQARGNIEWTRQALKLFDKNVVMSDDVSTIYLNAIETAGETKTDTVTANGKTTTYTTTLYSGTVTTDADGKNALLGEDGKAVSYIGTQHGENTWKDLSPEKDKDNWYAYNDASYLQKADEALFFTENLVFTSTTEENNIILNDTVDLGIGYVEFNKGEGLSENAKYTITSESGESHQLNTAGYVVNKGAEVHVKLTNPDNYMYEWRKNGAGDLHIDGDGNTHALLTVGGSGKTYLSQTNGYAAYNVLASSGATVVIKDVAQIKRDFTFGAGGGTLDMNGNFMNWTNSDHPEDAGFSIHALTEEAVIANYKSNSIASLIYTESGNQTWKGSFKDSENSALRIFYNGGENSTWTLNSIHTHLQNSDSAFVILSGSVKLAGTNTEHAMGSTGVRQSRLVVDNDWHYADATMNVTVDDGATFELGSHARLKGDVDVAGGGKYILREGTQAQYEYIEGGQILEDTYKIREFYGHHGNTNLSGTAEMRVEYSEGTTTQNVYSGNITGTGNMSVALGTDGATLVLSGNNTFSGTKILESGTLVDESGSGLGNLSQNKWTVEEAGVIASKTFTSQEAIFNAVAETSTGTVALQSDIATQLSLSDSHTGLVIGALKEHVVQYGEAGTETALTAYDADNDGRHEWRLGGGGGELVVNFKLSGDNDLILGNENAVGVVTLTNANNDFTGTLRFAEGIDLRFENDAVLGQSTVELGYRNRIAVTGLERIDKAAVGTVMLDKMSTSDIDLSAHQSLALGAREDTSYSGQITLAEGQDYRFGATEKTLTLNTTLSGNHGLIVDGRTHSGGTVALAQASTITGAVSVIGYDAAQARQASGDITLRLEAENALAQASSVTIKDGGILDLAGTRQSFIALTTEADGSIRESQNGSTLSIQSGELAGTLEVSTLQKTGEGELGLAGKSDIATLNLNSGALKISGTLSVDTLNINGGELTLSGSGYNIQTLVVNSGATFDMKGSSNGICQRLGTLRLNGGILANSSGVNTSKMQIDTLALDANSTINALHEFGLVGSAHTVTSLDLAGNTLTKTGNATFHLVNSSVTAGTINVQQGTVAFNDMGKEYDSTISASVLSDGGNFNVSKSGKGSLTLRGEQMDIHSLNQSNGAVNVDSGRINVGSFSGTGGSFTLTNATLGTLDESLSISRNLTLSGTATIHTQIAGTESAGEISISGAVSGGNLVKDGLGVLTLSGATSVGDLTVRQGTLAASGENIASGNIAIAQGASLMLSEALSLNAGKKLTVLASSETASASLLGALKLNGGTLAFDLKAPSETTPALFVGNITQGDAFTVQKISLSEVSALKNGQNVLLANSDWSAVESEKVELENTEYMNAEFSASQSGLTAVFTVADGYKLWNGTNDSVVWTAVSFGDQNFSSEDVLVFNDSAANKNVQISGDISAEGIRFDSHSNYTLSGTNTISLRKLTQSRSGTTTLSANLSSSETTTVDDGTLVLSGFKSSLSGTTSVNAGTLRLAGIATISGDLSVGTKGNFELVKDAVLFLSDTATVTFSNAETRLEGNTIINGNVGISVQSLSVGTLIHNGGATSVSGGTFKSNSTTLNAGTLSVNTVHSQLSDTTLNDGTLSLNGMTSLTGNTQINGGKLESNSVTSIRGTVKVGNNGNFQTGAASMLLLESGSSLNFNNSKADLAGALIVNASSSITAQELSLDSLTVLSGTLELKTVSPITAGSVLLADGAQIVFDLSLTEVIIGSYATIELLKTDSLTLGNYTGSQALEVIEDFISVKSDASSSAQYKQEWSYEDSTLSLKLVNESPAKAPLLMGARPATSATSAIPEPSAFGLLAGLGALALVAARRRRKKA